MASRETQNLSLFHDGSSSALAAVLTYVCFWMTRNNGKQPDGSLLGCLRLYREFQHSGHQESVAWLGLRVALRSTLNQSPCPWDTISFSNDKGFFVYVEVAEVSKVAASSFKVQNFQFTTSTNRQKSWTPVSPRSSLLFDLVSPPSSVTNIASSSSNHFSSASCSSTPRSS